MAARPLPTPEPDPTHKKTSSTGTAVSFVKHKFLEMVRTVSKAPAGEEPLHAIMNKRWLRFAGIAVAIFLVLLIALPFLINVNSFRPKIESEASGALGRQVTVGNLSLSILSGSVE